MRNGLSGKCKHMSFKWQVFEQRLSGLSGEDAIIKLCSRTYKVCAKHYNNLHFLQKTMIVAMSPFTSMLKTKIKQYRPKHWLSKKSNLSNPLFRLHIFWIRKQVHEIVHMDRLFCKFCNKTAAEAHLWHSGKWDCIRRKMMNSRQGLTSIIVQVWVLSPLRADCLDASEKTTLDRFTTSVL